MLPLNSDKFLVLKIWCGWLSCHLVLFNLWGYCVPELAVSDILGARTSFYRLVKFFSFKARIKTYCFPSSFLTIGTSTTNPHQFHCNFADITTSVCLDPSHISLWWLMHVLNLWCVSCTLSQISHLNIFTPLIHSCFSCILLHFKIIEWPSPCLGDIYWWILMLFTKRQGMNIHLVKKIFFHVIYWFLSWNTYISINISIILFHGF